MFPTGVALDSFTSSRMTNAIADDFFASYAAGEQPFSALSEEVALDEQTLSSLLVEELEAAPDKVPPDMLLAGARRASR